MTTVSDRRAAELVGDEGEGRAHPCYTERK